MAGNKKNSRAPKSKQHTSHSNSSTAEGTAATATGSNNVAETGLTEVKALPEGSQQFSMLMNKYSELAAQHNQLKISQSATMARCEAAEKSRDQLNTDYTKAMLSKAQMESLCRELQKQNKMTKEENLARIREEEEKRRDVSARLNNTLAEITGLMQQNTEKNTELRQENQGMATRLNELVSQYDVRQQHVDKILHQRDLQVQLAEAKLAKAMLELTEEREQSLLQKKKLLEDLKAYQEKVTKMATEEMALRMQLSSYATKYDEFQKTVEASNNIMNKFKKEMEGMGKKMKKLERETIVWQQKWEKSNNALINMVSERVTMIERAERLTKQNMKLQQLARTMQEQMWEERRRNKEFTECMKKEAATEEKVVGNASSESHENNEGTKAGEVKEGQVNGQAAQQCAQDAAGKVCDEAGEISKQIEDIQNSEEVSAEVIEATVPLNNITTQLKDIATKLAQLTHESPTQSCDPETNTKEEEVTVEITEL